MLPPPDDRLDHQSDDRLGHLSQAELDARVEAVVEAAAKRKRTKKLVRPQASTLRMPCFGWRFNKLTACFLLYQMAKRKKLQQKLDAAKKIMERNGSAP
jgi:hypothetical protein